MLERCFSAVLVSEIFWFHRRSQFPAHIKPTTNTRRQHPVVFIVQGSGGGFDLQYVPLRDVLQYLQYLFSSQPGCLNLKDSYCCYTSKPWLH